MKSDVSLSSVLLPDRTYQHLQTTPEAEAIVRAVARAVIRRVQLENPDVRGLPLRISVAAANPFPAFQADVQMIWQEEMDWALRGHGLNVN